MVSHDTHPGYPIIPTYRINATVRTLDFEAPSPLSLLLLLLLLLLLALTFLRTRTRLVFFGFASASNEVLLTLFRNQRKRRKHTG